jgi:hypothetical protein
MLHSCLLFLFALAALVAAAPIRFVSVAAAARETTTPTVTPRTGVSNPLNLATDLSPLLDLGSSSPSSSGLDNPNTPDASDVPGVFDPPDSESVTPDTPTVTDDAAIPDAPTTPDALVFTTGSSPSGKLVAAYYPDWAGPTFPPEKIAFALPDEHFDLTWDDPVGAPALLRRLVAAARSAGTKVKLSVGGWTGSKLVSWR